MQQKIKTGFIGYGKSTHRYHLPFINHTNKFEITGYYTTGRRTFEMEYPDLNPNITRFDNTADLLKSDVDLIIVTTPPEYHYQYAKEVIMAGKHVLVEKPFCEKSTEVTELFALARQHNVKVIPYQNRRFDSDFMTFKHVMENYDLGTVLEIESNYTHYRPDGADQRGNPFTGAVYGMAVHFLDQIISYFGVPDDVIYDHGNQKNYALGDGQKMSADIPDDYYDIKLIYDNLRVRVRFSQLIVKEPPRWIINGTNATFEKFMFDQQEAYLKKGIFLDNPEFGKDTEQGIGTIYYKDGSSALIPTVDGGYDLFYQQVYQCLNGEIEHVVSEQEIFTNIRLLEIISQNGTYTKL